MADAIPLRAAASQVGVVFLRAAVRSCTRSFWAYAVRTVRWVRLLYDYYDYYTKTTPSVIKHAEKRLEDIRTARAQEQIRGRASEHPLEQAATAAAKVQSSIVRFATDRSSSSSSSSPSSSSSAAAAAAAPSMAGTGSGSAVAAQTGANAPWYIPGARVAKKRRNNHAQRPGSSMFVNFAVNRDACLRDALKTAMREVAEVDYKAIAQHFNHQFATEEPPS